MKHMGQDERNRIEFMLGCGGGVAKNARLEIERKTGRKVISPLNASDTGALDVEGGDMNQLPPPPKRKWFRRVHADPQG